METFEIAFLLFLKKKYLYLHHKAIQKFMNTIVVYPSSENQISLLEGLLKEMKIRFSIKKEKKKDDSLFTKEEYFAMLDERIKSAKQGNYTEIKSRQELEQFLEQL
ncbi:hypothetical protein FACS189451_03180 [Bacteroidia bacterium]|nr:hypothetical protein FACS189451_03180 [Bacteroidia bacterium]